MKSLAAPERFGVLVRSARGHRVVLDEDLAPLYGVQVKVLLQAVKRNLERFPVDFMFQLTKIESDSLRSQFATLKKGRGRHRKYLPYVFTEQGVAMLSSVLRSKRAVQVNIGIMRTFVRLRQLVSNDLELAKKLTELERRIENHDEKIEAIFGTIRELVAGPETPSPKIGFKADKR